MSVSEKIKVRRKRSTPPPLVIRVREKYQYICNSCKNRYDRFYYFCPQCLGEIGSVGAPTASLILASLPEGKNTQYRNLLAAFAGREKPELARALRSLPWPLINDTDRAILEQWRNVLQVDGARLEIGKRTKKLRVRYPPLFPSAAPPPYFWSIDLISDIRKISTTLKSAAIRLALADAVGAAHALSESLHYHQPSDRILFADLKVRIEQLLQEMTGKFFSYYRKREDRFPKAIAKMMEEIQSIQEEIDEVRERVNEQL